jgi:hypothetical protein
VAGVLDPDIPPALLLVIDTILGRLFCRCELSHPVRLHDVFTSRWSS